MTTSAEETKVGRRKQDREFEALHAVNRLLTATLDVDEMLNGLVRLVVEKLHVKACTIRLLDTSTGVMALRAAYGLSDRYINKGPVVVWKGIFRDVLDRGKVISILDLVNDTRVQYPKETAEEGLRSALFVALMSGGKPFGALSAYTDQPHEFDEDEQRTFEIIAGQAAVGIQIAWLHRELVEKKVMDRELELAEKVQNTFMPQKTRLSGHFDICARSVPCRHIGGDFYELVEFSPNHLGIAIGDVSGKGIGASILMATTRASLRAHIESVFRVSDIIARVNRGLCRDSGDDQFVSLFYMVVEADGLTTYTNAGHCRPMLFADNGVTELDVGGPVLGVGDWVTHREGRAHMRPGNIMVLYTDGISETFSPSGEEFGIQRIRDVVSANLNLKSEELAEKIYEAVETHAGYQPPSDDRTLVVVRMQP